MKPNTCELPNQCKETVRNGHRLDKSIMDDWIKTKGKAARLYGSWMPQFVSIFDLDRFVVGDTPDIYHTFRVLPGKSPGKLAIEFILISELIELVELSPKECDTLVGCYHVFPGGYTVIIRQAEMCPICTYCTPHRTDGHTNAIKLTSISRLHLICDVYPPVPVNLRSLVPDSANQD